MYKQNVSSSILELVQSHVARGGPHVCRSGRGHQAADRFPALPSERLTGPAGGVVRRNLMRGKGGHAKASMGTNKKSRI